MNDLKEFMRGVKEGDIRGDFVQERVADDVVVELSVGPFEYGYIHLRVIVDDKRISVSEGMYYRRLYKIDEKYAEVHDTVSNAVEAENETAVENAHTWEAANPEKAYNFPTLPDEFSPASTVFFEDHIQLRDDVTIEEALLTNRADD